ncbi:restriction endonuclease subunit S [Pseudoxanthomonas sp. GW2]|uniref:restriction endonuclease subunit S n=1 Tax=Pseudoxanthomonas sp. GW2 TaxID=1211114 RepID=UPI001E623829|nr:restriction endonuclease subunit S [Pseudoxanthomonas sp. GW2]
MASEWRSSTWGDEVCLEYGKALRGYSQTHGKYRVFGSNGPIGWTNDALTQGPGVILGRKGAYRGVEYCRDPFWVIDTAYYIVPKTDLDMRWLYYAVKHYKLGEVDDGSPIPSTTRSAVYMLELDVPPKHEQRAIAHILGTLDDKIELNRKQNETLEAMARTLFKAWFVDFEPVRAKMEGRWQRGQSLPGLPAHLYDLFPDRLVESELGEIPEGWRVGSVYEVASVRYGAPFASSKFNSEGKGRPLVRIRDLRNERPGVWTEEVHPKGYLIQPGDIVVGMDGEFRAYLWGGEPAWMNQRICVFHPKNPHCAAFVRNAIKPHLARVEATEVATTVIHLGKGDIDEFRIVIPRDNVAREFEKLCQPNFDQIVLTKQQSSKLAQLRDTLLPKLISGELRIADAEAFLKGRG